MNRFSNWPGAMPPLPESGAMLDFSGGYSAASYPSSTAAAASGTAPTPERKRAQALQRAFSVASKCCRIRWTVDARKLLKSMDRELVSPGFDISADASGEST